LTKQKFNNIIIIDLQGEFKQGFIRN